MKAEQTQRQKREPTIKPKRCDMKRTCAFLLAVISGLLAWTQNHQYIPDTAETIIEKHLSALNHDNIPSDSLLYIESCIVDRNDPTDTLIMKRWAQGPFKFRVEVWHNGKRETGYYSNGKDRFRRYDPNGAMWVDVTQMEYYDWAMAYDFRGPLHNYKAKGGEVKYAGSYTYQGRPVDRVFVGMPNMYDRYYLFEQTSGLLFLIDESDHFYGDAKTDTTHHVEWRAYHEYQPLGESLFVSTESYMSYGRVKLIHHKPYFIKPNTEIFNKD